MRFAAGVGLWVALAASAGTARAESLPETPPSEPGRALGELGASVVAVAGTSIVVIAATNGAGWPVLPATPALAGLVVCGIGRGSDVYTGSCRGPIVGAYVGSLLAIPAAVIGCAMDRNSDSEFGCLGGLALGFAAGWTAGSSLGAVVGWQVVKSPRALPVTAALPRALPRPPALAPSRPPPGARVMVPVVALAF